jgi:hypothetical protein
MFFLFSAPLLIRHLFIVMSLGFILFWPTQNTVNLVILRLSVILNSATWPDTNFAYVYVGNNLVKWKWTNKGAKTCSDITFDRMVLGRMTLGEWHFWEWHFENDIFEKDFVRMTFVRMTFVKMILARIIFVRMTFVRKTLVRITFVRMTFVWRIL